MRVIWFSLGLLAMGLGLLGTVLPLLPTVPFVLLAAFCFARSSQRLHDWLMDHPVFGRMIRDWQENGAINRKAKVLSTISIVAVFLFSVVMGVSSLVITIQAAVLSCVLLFIWSRPNGST